MRLPARWTYRRARSKRICFGPEICFESDCARYWKWKRMENRFEHSQPEEQGWGAYVTPPRYTGPEHTEPSVRRTQTGLCARVVEMLPALLENDGDIRPEMAT